MSIPYKVKIDHREFSVIPGERPYSELGRPGSILDLATGQGIRLSHSCGGIGNCTTCHVYVQRGLETCAPPNLAERERLKEVYGLKPQSRLACLCVPDGSGDVEVEIP